jgi:F1F0 ATPase subunit 2
MINLWSLVASCFAGALLGLIFFWGLWTTVKQLERGRYTAVWMLGSFVLRFSLLLTGFYFLARYAGWEHVLSAAVGFTLSRVLVVHRLRPGHINEEPGA